MSNVEKPLKPGQTMNQNRAVASTGRYLTADNDEAHAHAWLITRDDALLCAIHSLRRMHGFGLGRQRQWTERKKRQGGMGIVLSVVGCDEDQAPEQTNTNLTSHLLNRAVPPQIPLLRDPSLQRVTHPFLV